MDIVTNENTQPDSSQGTGQETLVPTRPRPTARQINEQIVYTAYSVYARAGDLDAPAEKATAELMELTAELAERDVTIRGFYDVSGMRADADLIVR